MGNRTWHRGTGRRLALVAVTVVALLPGTSTAQPPDAAAPQAPTTTALAPDAPCTMRASADSTTDEYASCITVDAELDRAPAVGEVVTLRWAIAVQRPRASEVEIELPPTLEFVQAPAGFDVGRGEGRHGAGPHPQASEQRALAPGRPHQGSARVRAVSEGPSTITVRATAPVRDGAEAGEDAVHLTVGGPERPARFGFDVPEVGAIGPAPATGAPYPYTLQDPPAPAAAPVAPDGVSPPAEPSPAATICASGQWGYTDSNGVFRWAQNVQVEAWDQDTNGDDFLAVAATGPDGSYNLCFDSVDGDMGGSVDVYVVWKTTISLWRVENFSGQEYKWSSQVYTDRTASWTLPGAQPGSAELQPAMQAFDNTNASWLWTPRSSQGCWDRLDSTCRQIQIQWTPTSTTGSFADVNGTHKISLRAASASVPTVVVHEVAHMLMDDLYEDAYPPFPNCSPHDIPDATSTGCAWTEGWAEWYTAMVLQDSRFYYSPTSWRSLENPTWNYSDPQQGNQLWDDGDTVEGRVAGALIDISDATNEGTWDRMTESPFQPGNIWTTMTTQVSTTLSDFMSDRQSGGFDLGDGTFRSALYQNTVDYQYRQPLSGDAEVASTRNHNYRVDSSSGWWNLVAVRPATSDVDLYSYSDRALSAVTGASEFGSTTIDFLAIDGSRRGPTTDYLRAIALSGSTYTIEYVRSRSAMATGTTASHTFSSSDIVDARDVSLTPGTPIVVRATPAAGQDIELFLVGSTDFATSIRSRAQALRGVNDGGFGVAESFTYTPTTSGWHSIVVVNRSGSGTTTISYNRQPLTVSRAGTGSGTVSSTPSGISCGGTCTAEFPQGTVVALTASPSTGSTFASWSGACTGASTTCNVTMDQARNVTAQFNLQSWTLTASKAGSGTGSVSSSPAGITGCTTTCTASFPHGTSVTLTPSAASGSTFTGWSGACSGTGSCTVPMTSNTSVTATFGLAPRQLTVARGGTGSGSVSSSPAGITNCTSTCSAFFAAGTTVTLTATPATGSTFTSWTGCTSATASCSVTMDQARSVTATYTLRVWNLSVVKQGNGAGSVSSTPAGINGCTGTCTAPFDHGTSVTLSATPANGSTFTGWGHASCPGTGTCTLPMTDHQAVAPTFALRSWTVTATTAGAGTGTLSSSPSGISSCAGTCVASFVHGTAVTLTATPGEGSRFGGWSGAGCSGTGTCSFTVNGDTAATATFVPGAALTVVRAGAGGGTVTSDPAGIDCGATCTTSYDAGTSVTLSASPAQGSRFVGWDQDTGCGSASTCTLVLSASRTVTATFALLRPDLAVTSLGAPPTTRNRGATFAIGDTTANGGDAAAGASVTRFYLSTDTVAGSDRALSGQRNVAALAPGASSAGTTTVTIPAGTPLGTYRLVACADATRVVAEHREVNCRVRTDRTITVTAPDLGELAPTGPTSAQRGTAFAVRGATRNAGSGPAAASTTRYYLSRDAVLGSGDVTLTATRAVRSLAAGATSPTATTNVTAPSSMATGAWFLLACSDSARVVPEANERNNCRTSTAAISIR